jgi:serine/threonine protein kinase
MDVEPFVVLPVTWPLRFSNAGLRMILNVIYGRLVSSYFSCWVAICRSKTRMKIRCSIERVTDFMNFTHITLGKCRNEAKELVTILLTVNPSKRASAERAMCHKWMNRVGSELNRKTT